MKNSNFEDIFRNSGEHDRDFDFQESSWNDLEKKLDEPKKRRRFLWIWFLAPAILGTAFFANMLLKNDSDLSQNSTTIERSEDALPKKTQLDQPTKDEATTTLYPSNSFQKQKSKQPIASSKNIKPEKKSLIKKGSNITNTPNTYPINNTITKNQNSISDIFISVEENTLQPKNTKQHQKSTLSKDEPIYLEKNKVAILNQSSKKERDNISLSKKAPKLSLGLESSGMSNLDNNVDPISTPRERTWEIGLSVGFTFPETVASIFILTEEPIPGTEPFFPNYTPTELYYERYEGTDLKKRFAPLFRLSIGKEFRKSLLFRGGIILMRDSPQRRRTNDLLKSIPHEFAANFESISNYWLLDIGIHLQPNRKRWRPFLGVSPIFTFLHKQKNSLKVYSSNNEVLQNSKISSGINTGLNFTGLNIEGGMKYRITPRFEVGVQMYTIGFPFLNTDDSSVGNFAKPQFATSFSYKL